MKGAEFNIGDKIIYIGGFTTYDVLNFFDGKYELMSNDFLEVAHMCDKEYAEEHFVLVTSIRETQQ